MPAELVSNDAIPQLAGKIESPAMRRVLRRIQQAGFILNGPDLDKETSSILEQLAGPRPG